MKVFLLLSLIILAKFKIRMATIKSANFVRKQELSYLAGENSNLYDLYKGE